MSADHAGTLSGQQTESRLIRPVPVGGSSLVRDYLDGAPEALSFYSGSPFALASYRAKLHEVSSRFGREERAAAARTLRPTSDVARERLQRFVEEGGAMVTTGQQAGFLGGPLYTVYKALAAAALARHLEQAFGLLVLPVFWVASEDHDWAEVNHAYVLDAQSRLTRFALTSEDDRPLPMSERRVDGEVEILSERIAQAVAGNKSTSDWLRKILGPYQQAESTVAGAFTDLMAAILEPFDVCIADAADPHLKELSRPILREALVASAEHENRLEKRTEALTAAGYRPQVSVLERGTNVFYHGEKGRERFYRRGEDFLLRSRKTRLTGNDLIAELDSHPGRFSPNVFLRPVVESSVYPTLSYVGGPGELAYFAQVGALFDAFDILPPVAVPRFSAMVVEPKIERTLARLDLKIADTPQPREQLIERLARREIPGEVRTVLNRIRSDLTREFDRLLEEASKLDPTLAGPVGGGRNRVISEAAKLERKILRAIKRSDRIAADQLDRVLDSLRPNGSPQDRVLNVLPFLARYGVHFLKEVYSTIEQSWRLPE